jgi:hypothetical protein
MARNHEKYLYAELAIPRNSAWYPLLVAEAEAKGLPLAQVALERLAASYLTGNSTANPVMVTQVSAPGRQLLSTPPALPAPKRTVAAPAGGIPDEDDVDLELSEERAASNAAAFLDANGGGFF